MDKENTIEVIENAKKSHNYQTKKILAFLNGREIENITTTLKTECDFGKYIYDKNNHLKEIVGTLFYNKMEALHAQWHIEYKRVFEILFHEKNKSFFSKMLGSVKKVDAMKIDKAKLYYSELEDTNRNFLKILNSSQRRLEALNESKFTM